MQINKSCNIMFHTYKIKATGKFGIYQIILRVIQAMILGLLQTNN